MQGIVDLLTHQGDNEVEVSVREIPEVFEPFKPKEDKTSRIYLLLRFKGRENPVEIYLSRVTPERKAKLRPYIKSSDINYFTTSEQISIQKGLETDILTTLVIGYMAKLDPRIRGVHDAEPCVNITSVGGKPYNLDEMQAIYRRVQRARKRRTKERGKLREFLGWEQLAFNY